MSLSNSPASTVHGTLRFVDSRMHLLGNLDSPRNSGEIFNSTSAEKPVVVLPAIKSLQCEGFTLLPTDSICRFSIEIWQNNNPKDIRSDPPVFMDLPLRLFTHNMALTPQRDKVCFTYGGISYELLKSHLPDHSPFDRMLKSKIKQAERGICNGEELSYAFDNDAPKDGPVILFKKIIFYLQEQVEEIRLGQKGVHCVNANGIKIVQESLKALDQPEADRISCEAVEPSVDGSGFLEMLSVYKVSQDENGFMAGIVLTDNPHVTIFLNQSTLYVVLDSTLDAAGKQKEEGDLASIMFTNPRFYRWVLNGIIDKDNITASADTDQLLLKITIPYKKAVSALNEGIVSPTVSFEAEKPASTLAPSKEEAPSSVEVCAMVEVGFGRQLGIREESNWDKTIPFTWTSNGWLGQVPIGKLFKFIKVSSRGVVEWEQRREGNRFLKEGSQDKLVLTPKDIQF